MSAAITSPKNNKVANDDLEKAQLTPIDELNAANADTFVNEIASRGIVEDMTTNRRRDRSVSERPAGAAQRPINK